MNTFGILGLGREKGWESWLHGLFLKPTRNRLEMTCCNLLVFLNSYLKIGNAYWAKFILLLIDCKQQYSLGYMNTFGILGLGREKGWESWLHGLFLKPTRNRLEMTCCNLLVFLNSYLKIGNAYWAKFILLLIDCKQQYSLGYMDTFGILNLGREKGWKLWLHSLFFLN